MKVYIAGPMTGIPQFNYPAFEAMAKALRKEGHEVVTPTEMDDDEARAAALASPHGSMDEFNAVSKHTWGDFLSRDVKLLADDGIEGVVVLPGFAKSRGARLETFVARLSHIPILWFDGHVLRAVPEPSLRKAWLGDE